MKFTDRAQAGRTLAGRLQHYAGQDDLVVRALPRGGVPVAFEIARELGAPLEDFAQTTDEEVSRLLSLARSHAAAA